MDCGTYLKFFVMNKKNYLLLPLTIILFFLAEGFNAIYFRLLAEFEDLKRGTSLHFEGNFTRFWTVLSIALIIALLLQITKLFMINISILLSNTSAHEKMMESVVRSPSSYFDRTPSGHVLSKFSNDLGVADSSLILCFIDVLEGPSIYLIALLNFWQISWILLLPLLFFSAAAAAFFVYSR